jgi:hypothetical protein
MKKTSFFPAAINPVRVGTYEVVFQGNSDENVVLIKWVGTRWTTLGGRSTEFGDPNYPGDRWRGLAERPSGEVQK